jgi:hypothetical protein
MSSCSTCHTFNSSLISTIVTLCTYNLRKPASHQYFTLIIITLTILPHINTFCYPHHNCFLHHFPVNSLSESTSIIHLYWLSEKIKLSSLPVFYPSCHNLIPLLPLQMVWKLLLPSGSTTNAPPAWTSRWDTVGHKFFRNLHAFYNILTFYCSVHSFHFCTKSECKTWLHYCLDYVTSCWVMTQCNFHCYTHSEPGHVRVGPASRWNGQMWWAAVNLWLEVSG